MNLLQRISSLTLICAAAALAQNAANPNCQFSYTLTNRTTEQTDGITSILVSGGAARTPQINNQTALCTSWLMAVSVDGFSAASLELDSSANAYTTSGGTALAWAAFQGTILSGSNPTTTTTSTNISYLGFYPWLSVSLGSSTGTGSIHVTLYGWKTPTLLALATTQGTNNFIGNQTITGTLNVMGTLTVGVDVNIASTRQLYWNNRSVITSPADGNILVANFAGTSFTQFQFGGVTSAFPSLKRSSASLISRLADDSADTTFESSKYLTGGNCSNSAAPAVCGSAANGAVAIPTGVNPTLTINTSAVTAVSNITLAIDDSLTIAATTCNSTLATITAAPAISGRSVGVSFTVAFNGTVATNPVCLTYKIEN